MNIDSYFQGSMYDVGTLGNVLYEKRNANEFSKIVYDEHHGKHMSLSEFLDLQKKSEDSAELVSYTVKKGMSLKALDDDTARTLNDQINTMAALQTLQNFYDMYLSPVGATDVTYRLGEVTGRAVPGTVNSQTDSNGLMPTRTLYETKVDHEVWGGNAIESKSDYYSVLWFPPFKPSSIKPISWKDVSYNENGQQIMSLGSYLDVAKKRRQQELDEYNKDLIERGDADLITETEAEDTRLVQSVSTETNEAEYYDTFDLKTLKAARSSFTYRAPGFKAINDNINMLQWLFEGVSGIVSTYLTEWDISLYLQEGLISDSDGTLPNVILLTHRMAEDNPNDYRDERAAAWGVVNCAVSKLKSDNKHTWFINAYPQASFHSQYPNPNSEEGWTDRFAQGNGSNTYIPNYYKFGKNGWTAYLQGKDVGYRFTRTNNIHNKVLFQDFENAALSGYQNWKFDGSIWKALYTTPDDDFSDIDLIYLSTNAGLYKKKDLINQVELVLYGATSENSEQIVDGVAIKSADANNSTYTYTEGGEGGSGGNKYTPGSVFKGALTFLSMFNKKSSSKSAAMSAANNMNNSAQGNLYGAFQDSLGLNRQAASGIKAKLKADAPDKYLLGLDRCLTDNSNGVGVPQNNPTLYGGPHGYYSSPKSFRAYYQENSLFLRNVPRVDKLPDDLGHRTYTENDKELHSSFSEHDPYYYRGNEKWTSVMGSQNGVAHQDFEQSWSAGLARLSEGIQSYTWVVAKKLTQNHVEVSGRLVEHYTTYESASGGYSSTRYSHTTVVWPTYAPNGEMYHYYGSSYKVKEYHYISYYRHYWWNNWYYYNGYYRYNNHYYYNNYDYWYDHYSRRWIVRYWYWKTVRKAWHWQWIDFPYKRYSLHSQPDWKWKLVRVQHYVSYVAGGRPGFWGRWKRAICGFFGWRYGYTKIYNSEFSHEDYELMIDEPGDGIYTGWSVFDRRRWRAINIRQTNREHHIMTNMVDWNRGLGASNKIIFLTRRNGQPDCLFRATVTHKLKPVYYWCEHWRKYSSRRCKHWWERHNGWKHYMSVDLGTVDVFYPGLYKTPYTSLDASSNQNHEEWGYSEPPIDGTLNAAQRKFGFFSGISASCSDTRKGIGDLYENFGGREIPLYDPGTASDVMVASFTGIRGEGLFGHIPGLTKRGGKDMENFYDKLCCDQCRTGGANLANSTAFKDITFSYWQIVGYDFPEIGYNGNTYRLPQGRPHYIRKQAPNWMKNMILNMHLRNTFYRAESGPNRIQFNVKNAMIDVDGLTEAQGKSLIEARSPYVEWQGEKFTILAKDIIAYDTYKKAITLAKNINGNTISVTEDHDLVEKVYVRDALQFNRYYFTSYDIAPRFAWQIVKSSIAYLNATKELFCGRLKNSNGEDTGEYLISFEYIKRIMEGDATVNGLLSARTYYLADPDRQYIEDPDGLITIDGKKVSKCEEMYGYNPFIVSARKWFCNDKPTNDRKHRELENAINVRIETLSRIEQSLRKYVYSEIKEFSYDTIIESWKTINVLYDLKVDESIEEFFLSYLNVLYEARRFFINKRCNKQDGTLWACRHLEKMIPQTIASAISTAANINPGKFSETRNLEKVAFYEVQNTVQDKAELLEKRANNPNSTETLDDDRVKTVYVKVRYANEDQYNESQEKLKNGTLTENDEHVIIVKPWSYVKKRDGTFKNKNNGDRLREGETWNDSGFAVRYGKIKYAIKPRNGNYQLLSKEYKVNEENKARLKSNPLSNVNVKDYDEAIWHIDWGDEIDKTPIVYNLYGGTNLQTIVDLTKAGVTDPIAILCGAKQSDDFWKVQVRTRYPRAEGYKTQITLRLYESQNEQWSVDPQNNSVALTGAASYAMWPIIEEQADVIPNSGDLGVALRSIGNLM